MARNDTLISSLIQNARRTNPTLADLLTLMQGELTRIALIIDPPPISNTGPIPEPGERPRDITVFTYAFTRTSIVLLWNAPQDGFLMYEIRANSSTFSDGDHVLSTAALQAILDPNDSAGGLGNYGLIGDHVFTIKAFNNSDQESFNEALLTVTVPALGLITINGSVINNQVILLWNEPTSTFNIDHYEIYKNAVKIQDNIRGTFFVIQEIAGGTYQYGIKAIDIAGNESDLSTVNLVVNDPTDFEIQDEFISDFSGVKINCVEESVGGIDTLLACVNDPETYEDHFLSRFWNSPQNQIDAEFPLFIQPAAPTGSYKEIFDFGGSFANNIITYDWQIETVTGSVSVSVSTRTSPDLSSWSAPIIGTQIFAAGPMRYVEVTLSFVSSL